MPLNEQTKNPLQKGWAKFSESVAGEVLNETFAKGTSYWTAEEIFKPTVVVEVSTVPSEEGRRVELFTCITNPTGTETEYAGYEASMERETSGLFSFALARKKSGESSFTFLGQASKIEVNPDDLIGVSVSNGQVKFWHKLGKGSWTIAFKVNDSTFTKGYVAIGAELAARLDNFGVGPIIAEQFPELKVLHQLSAALNFLGILPRNTLHAIAATLNFAGAIVPKKITENFIHIIEATLSFAGSLNRSILHQIAASLSFAGTLTKRFEFVKVFMAHLEFVGTLQRYIIVSRIATLGFAGSVNRLVLRALLATLTSAGTLRAQHRTPGILFAGLRRKAWQRHFARYRGYPYLHGVDRIPYSTWAIRIGSLYRINRIAYHYPNPNSHSECCGLASC